MPTFPSDILSIQREINKMFDGFFRGGSYDDGSLFPATWSPAVDVAEHDDEYTVKVELPGVNKDDVKITVKENVLTIQGEKKQEKEIKDSEYRRIERSYGSFQRSFTLPSSLKADKIDASFKDGVLQITVPKTEEVKVKQIEVKVK
jgi:HSP20 family protein